MLSDLVIQPTTYCNIDCSYCYLPNRHLKRRMSLATLRTVLDDVFSYPDISSDLNVVWHAGEPLTLGINFYKEAFETVKRASDGRCNIKHRIQTNGVLLNDKWCDLIAANDVLLGLSVDGPAAVHDSHRRTRNGGGTHVFARKAMRLLQSREVDYRVICVLSRQSLYHPEELIDFFIDNNVGSLGFNLETVEGVNGVTSLSHIETSSLLRQFWLRLLQRIAARASTIAIREIDWAVDFVLSGTQNQARRRDNIPLMMLTVDVDGNYYTFSPELAGVTDATGRTFAIGKAGEVPLASAVQSSNYRSITSEVAAGVEMCRRECRYFAVCGGGSPSSKIAENGTFASTETLSCRLSTKLLFDVLSEILPQVAEFLNISTKTTFEENSGLGMSMITGRVGVLPA